MDAALFAIVYNTAAEALHGLQQQQPNSTLYSFDVLEAITYHLSRVPKRGVSSKRVVPTQQSKPPPTIAAQQAYHLSVELDNIELSRFSFVISHPIITVGILLRRRLLSVRHTFRWQVLKLLLTSLHWLIQIILHHISLVSFDIIVISSCSKRYDSPVFPIFTYLRWYPSSAYVLRWTTDDTLNIRNPWSHIIRGNLSPCKTTTTTTTTTSYLQIKLHKELTFRRNLDFQFS